MNGENLRELLFGLGCDQNAWELLSPYFGTQRLPRGLGLSVHQDAMERVGIVSTGYLRAYFLHEFEAYTIGVLRPGMGMPMMDYLGKFPNDLILEAITRVELFTVDIKEVSAISLEHSQAIGQLLVGAYSSLLGELTFYGSIGCLPDATSRVSALMNYGENLIGIVPNGVLSSAINVSHRHFVRIKNR